MLFPLKLPAGVLWNGTLYQSRGRWRDAQLVRFLGGTIRPVGGWVELTDLGGVGVNDGVTDPPLNVVVKGTNIALDGFDTSGSNYLKDCTPTLAPDASGYVAGWHGLAAYQAIETSGILVPGAGNTDALQFARFYMGRQSVCSVSADITYVGSHIPPDFVCGVAARMSQVAGESDTALDGIVFYATGVDATHVNLRTARYASGTPTVLDTVSNVLWSAGAAKRMRIDFVRNYYYCYLADAVTGYNASAVTLSSNLLSTALDDTNHRYAGLLLKDSTGGWTVERFALDKGPAATATTVTLIQKPGVTGTLTGTLPFGTAITPWSNSTNNPPSAPLPLVAQPYVAHFGGYPVAASEIVVHLCTATVADLLPNDAVTLSRTASTITGVPRVMHGWAATTLSAPILAIATNSHIYVYTSGVLTDITPSDLSAGGANTTMGTGAYGVGDYGEGKYGVGDETQTTVVSAAGIQLDNFGNYLLAVLQPSDGRILSWLPGDTLMAECDASAPTGCVGVVVTNERFIVALGAGSNAREVQWASQESLSDWAATALNTAGSFTLPGSGKLLCGKRGRNETLLWTDQEIFSMQYIGGTLVYSFTQLGQECGLIAPQAAAVVDGRAAWMGRRGFYVYDGFVKPAPSEVSDFVFQNFNDNQRAKCWAESRTDFGEIWFHYCSASATEPDRYVIWNYWENHWTPGRLSRSAGIDRGAFPYPMCATSDGKLYEHELGWTHAGPEQPYLESGPIEIGEGDQVMMVRQIVPDEATQTGQVLGSLHAHIYTAFYPTGTETQNGPYTLANPTSVRLTGRQMRLRLDEATAGDWRLGVVRLEGVLGGKR
jgi:hypothetical protein